MRASSTHVARPDVNGTLYYFHMSNVVRSIEIDADVLDPHRRADKEANRTALATAIPRYGLRAVADLVVLRIVAQRLIKSS